MLSYGRHHGVLFLTAPCKKTDDLDSLCDLIDEDQPRQALIRKNAGITCPFPGSRSFVYKLPQQDTCKDTHSQLISNGTQLHFLHNECHASRDADRGSVCEYDVSSLQCHAPGLMEAATWSCFVVRWCEDL